jgi:hypothetical protein
LITNLKNLKKNNIIAAKVCIIGGGTAGLFLAHRLRLSKIPVTIVEAGEDQTDKLKNFIYKIKNNSYEQSIVNKNFSLGGTSTIWGGQMIPFQKSDINKRDYIGIKSWSIKYKQIAKYFPIVKKCFKFEFLKNKSKFFKKKIQYFNFSNKDFDLRFSTFIKPKIKNFYHFFYKNIKEDDKLNIYINAKVFEINNSKNNNSIKNIRAKSDNGNTLQIETDIVIICCGAIESTKLLLVYNKQNNNFIKINKNSLGHYFCDQLSFVCGEFIINDWKSFILYFSPIYNHGLIHNPRLELKNKFQKKNKISSAYCHFIFEHKKEYWLNLIKNLFITKEINFKSILSIILSSLQIIKDIYNLFYFRTLNKSVWFNRQSKILFSIVLEQLPDFNNKLSLKKNTLNSNKLIIDWKIKRKDTETIKLICSAFKNAWEKGGLNKIAKLKIKIPKSFTTKNNFKGAQHYTGTIKIGSQRSNSVVNKDLKLWNINNLYICSTAVFPSSGCSNTGFTLLALTARLEDHLKKKLIYS